MTPELYHILLKNVILFSRPEKRAKMSLERTTNMSFSKEQTSSPPTQLLHFQANILSLLFNSVGRLAIIQLFIVALDFSTRCFQ